MPRTISAVLDHRIRLSVYDIPDEADDAILEALCIPNLERENAKKHHVYGWEDLPEHIVMYGLSKDGILDMPRGFGMDLADGLWEFGVNIDWDDRRANPTKFRLGQRIEKRAHQEPAVDAILEHEQGIYKAPPGSGKTVAVLAAGRRAGTRCIIVVNTKDILYQWVDRIHEHLGDHIPVGVMGDGKFNVESFWNVATAPMLHSRFDEIEPEGFFDEFGFACLDESHHATAETYSRIMDRFSSRIRIGVSATPDKTGDFTLAQMILGPVFHETKHGVLLDSGFLVKPTIHRVKTDFAFAFRGSKSRWVKTNYPDLIEKLIWDRRRNMAIVGAIMENVGHHCLVLTKRLDHIDLLSAMLEEAGWPHPIVRLTGQESTAAREQALLTAAEEPSCMFSTLADEAVDVPRWDRGFLVFPQKNNGLIAQQVGRFERACHGKKDAIVYDFMDPNVTALKAQWTSRRLNVYLQRGFTIVKRDIKEFL